MGISFTDEQRQVIELRNRNILVSAAAGSGKTAVLVERIITRLTKDEKPLNVDELLIVTFTEAAASEMKERIHRAIEKALEEQPENEHLQRQATLIHQAQITTIHKFCLSIIRDYFHTIHLDPGFRVAETGELNLVKRDVVEQILEDGYQENDEAFINFVECFAAGKSDQKLEELILKIYERSRSYPDPEEWLDGCVNQYNIESVDELEEKDFVIEVKEDARQYLQDLKSYLEFAIGICQSEDGPTVYVDALQDDCVQLEKISQMETFAQMQEALSSIKWVTLKTCRDQMVCETKKQQVKDIRDEMKEYVKSLKENYFFASAQIMQQDILKSKSNVMVLIDLTKKFAQRFAEEKKKKNLIDFNDMEQFALQILTRKEDGVFVPSVVAEVYQEKYLEIMIDEYQDSNYVQETILTSVSKVSKGIYNIFMVGDVKQSIYRFRLSRPELFMEKFDTYSLTDSQTQRIDLHKNFRSRAEVLDSTNFVFEQIMIRDFGGIEYDEKAALYVGADYDSKEGNETEILLVETPDLASSERVEVEALAIAKRIKELLSTHEVLDKHTKCYRKAQYKDIAILTRYVVGWSDVLANILNAEGIPTYATSREGYFETQEIKLLLQYLNILDNPRQDIPFAAVLKSSFAEIEDEELACIRNYSQKKTMYECVCEYLQSGEEGRLKQKLQRFFSCYEMFRERVPYTSVHTLLWQIIEESGYKDYISALPGGEQRAANVEMLVEKAIAFEGTSYKGLFNFVRYIEQLQKYKVDFGEANLQDEQNDVVSLMSIHKSKGLEFPIVFVAGMGKSFDTKDKRESVVIHSDLGLGIESIDPELRIKSTTLLKRAIQQKNQKENKAEELRILYVAMTRAKEKLIMTGTSKDFEKEVGKFTWLLRRTEKTLPYKNLTGANNYMDWVLPVLLRNKCADNILVEYDIPVPFTNPLFKEDIPFVIRKISMDDLIVDEVIEQCDDLTKKEMLLDWQESAYDKNIKMQIEEQFSYSYPYQKGLEIKQKLSVSELKKQALHDEDGENVFAEEEVIPLLPRFLREEEEVSGATKGTAYHKLLELLDNTQSYSKESLETAIEIFKQNMLLTEEMFSCISKSDILSFLNSPIGQRMHLASKSGRCFKEQPFVLGIEANRVYPDMSAEEIVLVQGIIDVYFEEEDGLVVLDYKTDRVWDETTLIERYRTQLDYYAEALERVTGKKVKERVIYSFALKKEVCLC